jgi:hypothetical protein
MIATMRGFTRALRAGRDRPTPSLPPAVRIAAYGAAGSLVESAFTSVRLSIHGGRPALSGPSTAWMFPIYGLALPLFEPVHDRIRSRPAWQRGAVYAGGIFAVEAAAGWLLRRATGNCPWDYSGRSPLSVAGLIRLDYAPFWALAGLGAERLHDALAGGGRSATIPGRGPLAQW